MKGKILVLGSVMMFAAGSYANEFNGSVGMGAGAVQSPYQGVGTQGTPIPGVDVSYGDYYIKAGDIPYTTIGFGYNFLKGSNYVLGTSINIGGFDVDRSKMDRGYNDLDKRNPQIELALKGTVNTGWNGVIAEGYGSVGEEGGHLGTSLLRPFQASPRLTLVPKVSFTYFESDYTEYYFGITEGEAGRSRNYNIDGEYNPGSAFVYGANLAVNYAYTEALSFYGFVGVDKFSSEVNNSPIVEKDVIYKTGAGISYRF